MAPSSRPCEARRAGQQDGVACGRESGNHLLPAPYARAKHRDYVKPRVGKYRSFKEGVGLGQREERQLPSSTLPSSLPFEQQRIVRIYPIGVESSSSSPQCVGTPSTINDSCGGGQQRAVSRP